MNYKIKSLLQWAFSLLPYSHAWNRMMQLHVSRSLPVSDLELEARRKLAADHLQDYVERRGRAPERILDIGSGSDLSLAILMGQTGPQVTAADIAPLASRGLIANMLGRLGLGSLDEAHVRYVVYQPPKLPFPDASFDLVTSTSVLEHIPADQLPILMAELRRVLKPDGIASHHIAHRDHWSTYGIGVHFMNYVRYGPRAWKRYNPPIMYQNRLLHSQYCRLLDEAGFRFSVKTDRAPSLPPVVDASFRHFSPEDLTTYHSWFACEVVQKGERQGS